VLIVVASGHRAAAFEACRWLIDTLKKTVPIWKKEQFVDGAVWADGEAFPDDVGLAEKSGRPLNKAHVPEVGHGAPGSFAKGNVEAGE
jgi:MoaE protein